MKTVRTWLALLSVGGLVSFGATGSAFAHDTGPHKGPIAEWGEEEYHVEVVPDAKAGSVTVYVFGSHEDLGKGVAKAIDSKSLVLTIKGEKAVTIKLDPSPAKDDPKGKSSVFVGKHDVLSKAAKLTGTVSGKVGNKPYSGDFQQK